MHNLTLPELTIHGARELLDSRQISSVDLVKAVLERISEVEDRIKAFITVTPDKALEQARESDVQIANGDSDYLTGIPVQIKDNICTKGIKTTCSSRMLENFVPTYDATVASKLYDKGAILIGKGNLDEFAMGSSTENSAFFPTSNPWDTERVPGGSSGGPAAAVAAGECLASVGSDTGGSVRQPAAVCGVVGLKPTYGLVSRYGLVAFASSLDQIGPITKDVTDSAIMLNTLAGHDSKDSTSIWSCDTPDYLSNIDQGIDNLKIGIPSEYLVEGMENGVKTSILKAIDILIDLGADVEEVSLPHSSFALAVYYIIAPSEASANLARYDGVKYGYSTPNATDMWDSLEKTRQEGFGDEVKRRVLLGSYALSSGYYDAYYLKAQKVRTLIRQEFRTVFDKFDALVTPTSPSIAFKFGDRTKDPLSMYVSDILTIPANIAGIPGISVPAGISEGMPVGLQILGPTMGENTLFRIAHAYEQATEWHTLRPKL